ncbi:MAG: tetratricopeptide repeat protein [Oligoflexus sp.]
MSQTLPFSAAIVMTNQRVLADRLRSQLNQLGIPFVHTPTDQVHARELLLSDDEAILIAECDEVGGICHQMLEELSFTGQSRLRPVMILVDESSPELSALALDFLCCEQLSAEEEDIESHLHKLGRRYAHSLSLREKYRAARFLRSSDQLQDAEALLLELIERETDCPAISVELAEVLREQGRLDESLAILREALEADQNHLAAWQALAQNYLQKKRWGQAIDALEKALEKNPLHGQRRLLLAEALSGQGQYSQAMEHYQIILATRGDHEEASLGLIINGLLAEEYAALAQSRVLQEKAAMLASQCNRLAFTYMQAEDWQRALTVMNFALQQVQKQTPIFAKIAFNLGVIFHKQGEKEAACRCFALAAVIDPNLEKAKSNWLAAAHQCTDFDLPEPSEAIRSLLTGEPLAISESWPMELQEVAAAQQIL